MTKVIGLTGLKGSGKDTAGQVLKAGGYQEVKMAGALKEMTRTFLYYQGVDSVTVERMVEGDLKEVPSVYFERKTPREFMQLIGTEFGRDMIGPDIWVNSAMRRAATLEKVYCTDIRFPNEAAALREIGGRLYRIQRDTDVNVYSLHESEKHIPNLLVSAVIDNDGTIEELHQEMGQRFFPGEDLKAMMEKHAGEVTIRVNVSVDIGTRVEWWDEFKEGTLTPTRLLELQLDFLKSEDIQPFIDALLDDGAVSITGRVL
jgi:hypothetical protein